MDYKKIIKSRKMRIKIIQFFNFISDKQMLKFQYRIKTGNKLDLNNPKRFTEKLQWYKLYYRDPLMAQCVDKYEVRKYIEDIGFGYILNELYGIYESPEEVNFDKLPESFVLKDTLGSGGDSVIIVKDKKQIDLKEIHSQMLEWVNEPVNKKNPGREWVYDGRKHRIIAEKLLEQDVDKGGLIDYKFFCFNGKAEYLYIITDRVLGEKASFGVYNSDCNKLNVTRVDEQPPLRNMVKPQNYRELKNVAEKIARNFPEVRVDLYDIDGKIIFGEITFFSGSGYIKFEPDVFDYEMGEKFELPNKFTD